jgi:multidrug transporter EmrE-like cation transporter
VIPLPYVLTILAVLAIATGQILFKITASRITGRALTDFIMDPAVLGPFVLAGTIYAGATVLWIMALRDLPLGRAYMFMALSFVIVPLVSMLLFSERLSLGFGVGVSLIIAGLIVTQIFG